MNKIIFLLLHFFSIFAQHESMYICTAASTEFFTPLLTLIGSLHKVNFNELAQLAIFDLGLTLDERMTLEAMEKIKIYTIQITNEDMLKPFKTRKHEEKYARGWYSWKPVIFKQALEMFPYILYMDAGTTVYKPLNDIFDYIQENGYFFSSCNQSIYVMTTKYIINKFNLKSKENRWLLNDSIHGIRGGFQGLSRSMYESYVLPIYQLTYDIRNFEDDGTAPLGFGSARNDQPLFSIYAHILGCKINKDTFTFKGKTIHTTDQIKKIDDTTVLCHTRMQADMEAYKQYIRYKK
jgi:hypothetical protein